MESKSEIRKYIKEKKQAMTYEAITVKSEMIKNSLINEQEYKSSENILIYVSYNQEVQTKAIITYSLNNGKNVYVPKVFTDKENDNRKYMEFVRIKSLDELAKGYMGILEPVSDESEAVDTGLLVMPGLAFDENKNRIGYGGGFYDRYLSEHMSDFFKIALAFDYQIVDNIAAEEFDIKPDKIITDKRIIV